MSDAPDLLRIEGGGTCLACAVSQDGLPLLVHFGAPMDLTGAPVGPAPPHQWVPGMLPPPSLFPQIGFGHCGQPALSGHRDGGSAATDLRVVRTRRGTNWLAFALADPAAELAVTLLLAIDRASGVLTARSTVCNTGTSAYRLERLAGFALPLPDWVDSAAHFEGAVIQEGHLVCTPLGKARFERVTRDGRPGHDWTNFVFVAEPSASDAHGRVFAAHVDTIGNVAVTIDTADADGRTMLLGEWLEPGEVVLAPGERYVAPRCHVAWSEIGYNGASARFHDYVRARLPRTAPPVQLNSWEAVYLDVDQLTAMALADEAARLGVERFVLDDGWFGARDRDDAGLGDWTPHPAKFPDGLNPLIEHVHARGMGFGLWVEPEMVNPDSGLYRAHPDWVLALSGRSRPEWRHQLVLDLTQAAPRRYVTDMLIGLLRTHAIDYLKWDCNRGLFPSAGRARAQARAVLDILREVHRAFPRVALETCASGGGRFSFAMLRSCSRVWISDNTDPIERVRIQRSASMILPPETLGAHVGRNLNPSTERGTPMAFRCLVSLSGHFGIELDPRRLDDEERATLMHGIAQYKHERDFLGLAHIVRLDAKAGTDAQVWIAPDGNRALVRVLQVSDVRPGPRGRIRWVMPTRHAHYRVTELFLDGSAPVHVATASGAVLADVGLHLLPHFATQGRLFEVERI